MTFSKPKPLLASGVVKALNELARLSGKDVRTRRRARPASPRPAHGAVRTGGWRVSQVQSRKKEKIKHMLVCAQGREAMYIVRALQAVGRWCA